MHISHLLWVFVAVSFGSGKALGQTADELWAKSFRGDLARMEEVARSVDVRAEAWMGLMLQNRGRRLEAKEWWRRAAD